MQPDRPLYEEMLRRGSRARWFWLAGVWLNVAGLVGVVVVLAVWPVMFFLNFGRTGIGYAVALLLLGVLAVLGNALRRLSYGIALREGIDITAYFEKDPPPPGKPAGK